MIRKTLLAELIVTWQVMAEMEEGAKPGRRETLRECADLLNMLIESAPGARPVTPLTCPKCNALWLFWPAEQIGIEGDTLQCRSATWCTYCEAANAEKLQTLGLQSERHLVKTDGEPAATLPR